VSTPRVAFTKEGVAMATKRKKDQKARTKKKPPIEGDSPITVGGGGGIDPWVDLDFDHDNYVPDPDDRDNFVNLEGTLAYIQINNGNPRQLPPTSEIIVAFKKGGSNRKITIAADPPNDIPLGVKFKAKELKYNYQERKHRDDGSQLVKVTINGEVINLATNDQIYVHTS
jgi:hypothetical protein